MSDKINKTSILVITSLASFLTPFMTSATNIALPIIGKEFSMNAVLIGWVATSYLLATAVFLVPFGKISDIFGRKKIFLYGVIIYTVSSILVALANTSFLLILFRVIQGFGSAMIFGTSIAILTSVFPFGERGKVLGINVAVTYLGLSSGPFLGGLLTQYLTWRSIFLFNGLLGVAIIILTLIMMKTEWTECKREKIDFLGSGIYGIGLLLLIYGLTILPKTLGFGLVIISLIAIFIFISWELKIANPILNIRLFRNNIGFGFSNLAASINYSATAAVGFLISLYLQNVKGLSPSRAGVILIAQPIMMSIFSPFAGRLSDKIEARITASIGMAITLIALVLLIPLKTNTPTTYIVIDLLILGLGFAIFSSPNMNAIMSSVGKEYYGVASGTLATMRMVGQMFSMGIAMFVISLIMGRVQIAPANFGLFLKSTRIAFTIFSVLCFGGIFASLARGKLRQTNS
jgi:EmrB/QacA subfamily drug resistance transporter